MIIRKNQTKYDDNCSAGFLLGYLLLSSISLIVLDPPFISRAFANSSRVIFLLNLTAFNKSPGMKKE